jgi:DNA polymerase
VLDPRSCPDLGTTLVPLLHPSYQEVWLGRLGYDYGEYVAEIRDVLAGL